MVLSPLRNIPAYAFIEFLNNRDLINLASSNHYFKLELYHKAKPFVHSNSPAHAIRILTFFKHAKLKISSGELFDESKDIKPLMNNIIEIHLDEHMLKLFDDIKLSELRNLTSLDIDEDFPIADIIIPSTIKQLTLDTLDQGKEIKSVLFTNLTSLDICYGFVTDSILAQLTKLTKLDIYDETPITNHGLSKLINLKQLDLTDIQSDKITDEGICPLTNLTALFIHGTRYISDDIFKHLQKLLELSITGDTIITDRGIYHCINLRSLTLYGPHIKITDITMQRLTNLTSLDISSLKLTDKALIGLEALVFLGSGDNEITDDACKHLTNIKSLDLSLDEKLTDKILTSGLTSLNISSNDRITDEGLRSLIQLQKLSLYHNVKITDYGLETLGPSLISLKLYENENVTDRGICGLTNLLYLNISGNKKITDMGILPLKKLKRLDLGRSVGTTNVTFECVCSFRHLRNVVGVHRIANMDKEKRKFLGRRGIILV
ncbi:MAG: hypothetical protein Harvfovirus5_40 [Harvfovirus sp.]|uniref:F-box domain-containing protein n=1 Tax=Harvfovirus sp. TaxID=2487768 RepID=A0A3G5A0I7_9VIRU|nr:MAG: hypothetical protein Harvfovirus5_40 [Harvfovirus sp.]